MNQSDDPPNSQFLGAFWHLALLNIPNPAIVAPDLPVFPACKTALDLSFPSFSGPSLSVCIDAFIIFLGSSISLSCCPSIPMFSYFCLTRSNHYLIWSCLIYPISSYCSFSYLICPNLSLHLSIRRVPPCPVPHWVAHSEPVQLVYKLKRETDSSCIPVVVWNKQERNQDRFLLPGRMSRKPRTISDPQGAHKPNLST